MSQIPAVIPLDGTNISSLVDSNIQEETKPVTLKSSSNGSSPNIQQQNNLSSINSNLTSNLPNNIETSNDKISNGQTVVGSLLTNEISNPKVIVFEKDNDDSFNEQNNFLLNESTDKLNPSSLSFLQTKQRRINHRRNKSEPVIIGNLEDVLSPNCFPSPSVLEASSTSTTSNESTISSTENKLKSLIKTNSSSTNFKQTGNNNSSQIQDKSLSTKKKKPWYYPFQSSYRQRNEEFRKLFKDLPNDERLIVDYSCAWQKEILIQGRMYISQYNLCFHANFLKWETSLCLKFKDIIGITREKTAKVIPNAIEIRSNKNERYFFASFATRDKTYAIINKIWKITSNDQTISAQHLWNMIHESYGNYLDMTTDEEDTFNKQSTLFTNDKNSSKQNNKTKTNEKEQIVTPSLIHSKLDQKPEISDCSSVSSRSEQQTDDDQSNLIPIGEEANTNTLIRQPILNLNIQEDSLIPMSITQEKVYLCRCPCRSHLATELINRTYPISVERLFDYIFNDKDFLAAYHASRRIKEYNGGEWKVNEQTGKRERVCTYKVSVTAVFGSTTICSNEKQIIDCELAKSHYIIDTEVRNEGIKHADAFFVASRYCLVQTGPNKSHLKVTCEVRYIKSLMMIIKSFIEKNAMAALQDSYTDLNNRIELSTSPVKRIEHESSNISKNNEKEKMNYSLTKKRHSRKSQSNELNDSSPNIHRKQPTDDEIIHQNQISSFSSRSRWWSTNRLIVPLCLITMLLLVSVNLFLCVKLNQIDRMTDRLLQNSPLWSNEFTYPKEENEWSILLKRQEEYYQTKLTALRSVLISTHNALKNVTDALNELSKLSSIASSNAPSHYRHTL